MDDKFVFVGRKECGCAVGIVTDRGDRATARTVADFIISGLIINRVSWSKYKQIADEATFMNCPHGQLQLPGFEAEQ